MTVARPRPARVIGLLFAVALFGGVLTIVQSIVYIPVLNDLVIAIGSTSGVPTRIHACGRTWGDGANDAPRTMAQVIDQFGVAPPLTTAGFIAPCPARACTANAANVPCSPLLLVRVADDRYLIYDLSGGP